MPALTHGRVINGFNQYARSITYARPNCPEKPTRDTCGGQKPFCCGNPLQPFKNNPGTYCGSGFCRIPTGPCTRKHAPATGVVGRSFAAKRAIGRRVANCHGHPSSCALTGTATGEVIEGVSAAQLQSLLKGAVLIDGGGWGVDNVHVIKSGRVTSFRAVVWWWGTAAIATVDLCLGDHYRITPSGGGTITQVKVPAGSIEKNYDTWFLTLGWPLEVGTFPSPHINPFMGNDSGPGTGPSRYPLYLKQGGAGHSCCCMLPTVTFTKPVNAYHMPARCAKGDTTTLVQRKLRQAFVLPGPCRRQMLLPPSMQRILKEYKLLSSTTPI